LTSLIRGDLGRWLDYVFSAMKCCMLYDLRIPHLYRADEPKLMTHGRLRHAKMSIEGYTLTISNVEEWRFERVHFIKQLDTFNCGPIACMKILEMFHLIQTMKSTWPMVQIVFKTWLLLNKKKSYNNRNRTSRCVLESILYYTHQSLRRAVLCCHATQDIPHTLGTLCLKQPQELLHKRK